MPARVGLLLKSIQGLEIQNASQGQQLQFVDSHNSIHYINQASFYRSRRDANSSDSGCNQACVAEVSVSGAIFCILLAVTLATVAYKVHIRRNLGAQSHPEAVAHALRADVAPMPCGAKQASTADFVFVKSAPSFLVPDDSPLNDIRTATPVSHGLVQQSSAALGSKEVGLLGAPPSLLDWCDPDHTRPAPPPRIGRLAVAGSAPPPPPPQSQGRGLASAPPPPQSQGRGLAAAPPLPLPMPLPEWAGGLLPCLAPQPDAGLPPRDPDLAPPLPPWALGPRPPPRAGEAAVRA